MLPQVDYLRSVAPWCTFVQKKFHLLSFLVLILTSAAQAQFNFSTTNDTITITGYTGSISNVVVPDTINGLPVVAIGDRAFQNKLTITNVVIGSNVKSIGRLAFSNLGFLKSVSIPEGVTNIAGAAFAANPLREITFPESLIAIGAQAFDGCDSLTSLRIPPNVLSIGPSAFSGCDHLAEIVVDPANVNYLSKEGVLYNSAMSVLMQYPPASPRVSFEVPNGVTVIARRAFDSVRALTTITLPNTVTNIENSAFLGCGNLQNIDLPTELLTIGPYAFSNCSSLTRIKIPEKVKIIDSGVFSYCPGLQYVVIGRGVTEIRSQAFQSCFALREAYFEGNAPQTDGTAFGDSIGVIIYYGPESTNWGETLGFRPTALWNPIVSADDSKFGVVAGTFGFNIFGSDGLSVIVESTDDLSNPSWVPVSTNVISGGASEFRDPEWTRSASKVYRFSSPK
jgi:hypothetical protein